MEIITGKIQTAKKVAVYGPEGIGKSTFAAQFQEFSLHFNRCGTAVQNNWPILPIMIHFLEGTDNYGIFHATCEGETNWADFTEAFYAKLGITAKVNHITSEEYARMNPEAAKRPAYWEDALDVYLKDFDMENC